MKTINKYPIFISIIFCFLSFPLLGQSTDVVYTSQSSGSLTLNAADCLYDYWNYSWEIIVPKNTPIKLSCSKNTYDYFEMDIDDDVIFSSSDHEIFSKTVVSKTGLIEIFSEDGGCGKPSTSVFTVNFSIDASYTLIQNASVSENAVIGGKLDVKGNVSIGPYRNSVASLQVYNTNNLYSISSFSVGNSTGPIYGIQSDVYNFSGPGYGIYSNVSGAGTANQRWAGYFTGGDVEVNIGNLKVTGGGKVGIGTTTPRANLEVFGNNTTPKMALRFTGADQFAKSYIQSDTDGHYLELGTFGTSVLPDIYNNAVVVDSVFQTWKDINKKNKVKE